MPLPGVHGDSLAMPSNRLLGERAVSRASDGDIGTAVLPLATAEMPPTTALPQTPSQQQPMERRNDAMHDMS